MKKISFKSLLWLIFFIFIIFLTFASIYIGRNFVGIGPVPTRSAFSGRLPFVQEGEDRRFQFFYATNRENTQETFDLQGNRLGKGISTGLFDVLISPYLQIMPFVWFDYASVNLASRQEVSTDLFQKQLNESIQKSPEKSVLIIVWGFRDWFQSSALKTAYTAYALDINTPVVLFDWPGNQGEGFSGYNASQKMAAESAPDLGRFLADVIEKTDVQNVWIMGSSLGCQTICDALAWLKQEKNHFIERDKISHVVLSAPDVSINAFNDKFAETIQALSKHLTAYVTSNDRALLMSQWLNGERRLGRTADITRAPEDRDNYYEFEEALELLKLKSKGAKNISIVDATPINLLRNLHHFFTDSPVFFDDLYQRLLQPDHIVSRRLHPVKRVDNESHWILWND